MKPADFPLTWPEGRDRTPEAARDDGRFRSSFEDAYDALVAEAERLHDATDRDVIISTNVPLGAKGLPLVGTAARVHDPGVAVYLWRGGQPYAIACDTYRDVAANMRAITATIGALRTVARHGTAGLATQSMAGFARELSGRADVPRLAASAG